MVYVIQVLQIACEQDQEDPSGSCLQAVSKPVCIAVCTVKTPDDGQRNCPKHVEFYSKNKFQKLVHLVGFIIRIYHDEQSPERQIYICVFPFLCIIMFTFQNSHNLVQNCVC